MTGEAKEMASKDAKIQQLEAMLQQEAGQAQKRSDADAETIAAHEDTIAELEVITASNRSMADAC